jgi:S-formylglutathione hydrolase FrmB
MAARGGRGRAVRKARTSRKAAEGTTRRAELGRAAGARSREEGWVGRERIASLALQGNALGDPSLRDVYVYLPPGYDTAPPSRRYPLVLLLTGFTGLGESPFQRQAFSESLNERLDRLIDERKIAPMIVASPDCFTSLGGSQYVDSPAVGDYETFVVREVVPHLDALFRTREGPRHHGVCGKSSGGYGALMLGMKHPDVFGAVASHAGDAYFDYCYAYDFVKCWDALRDAGGVAEWLAKFRAKPKKTHQDTLALNIVAMSACYSPNAKSAWGFDLPFDLETGEMDPKVLARWRKVDPVNAVRRYAGNIRRLRGIYLDCGLKDEFAIHAGTRILAKRLRALGVGVPLVHEEFDDGHMGINYRYDHSFAQLAKWLA